MDIVSDFFPIQAKICVLSVYFKKNTYVRDPNAYLNNEKNGRKTHTQRKKTDLQFCARTRISNKASRDYYVIHNLRCEKRIGTKNWAYVCNSYV